MLLLDRRGESGGYHPQPVTTTFWLASGQVEREQSIAVDLLYSCAFLHAEAIHEELFEVGAAHLGPKLASLDADPLCFDQVITILRNHSFLQHQPEARTFSVHRLVQVVLRGRMSEAEQALWRGRVLAALNVVFPEVTPETWEQCRRLLPHVQVCVTAFPDQAKDQTLAEVLQKAAEYLRACARYTQAELFYQRALCMREQMKMSQHPQVALSLHKLAKLKDDQRKYARVEPLNDPLHEFLTMCCELHPRAWCRSIDLWQAYERWAEEHQEHFPLSRRAFITQLKAHGCHADRTKTARIWRGIALVRTLDDGR